MGENEEYIKITTFIKQAQYTYLARFSWFLSFLINYIFILYNLLASLLSCRNWLGLSLHTTCSILWIRLHIPLISTFFGCQNHENSKCCAMEIMSLFVFNTHSSDGFRKVRRLQKSNTGFQGSFKSTQNRNLCSAFSHLCGFSIVPPSVFFLFFFYLSDFESHQNQPN